VKQNAICQTTASVDTGGKFNKTVVVSKRLQYLTRRVTSPLRISKADRAFWARSSIRVFHLGELGSNLEVRPICYSEVWVRIRLAPCTGDMTCVRKWLNCVARQQRLVLTSKATRIRHLFNDRPNDNPSWRWLSAGVLHRVGWYKSNDVWKVLEVSINRAIISHDEGSKHLWNVGKILPDYTEQHPGRQSSSYSPPWEPQISPIILLPSIFHFRSNFIPQFSRQIPVAVIFTLQVP
jgi:hypothetical protein